jgi:hypothetical protein
MQLEGGTLHTLSLNIAWDAHCQDGEGAATLAAAADGCLQLLQHVAEPGRGSAVTVPQATIAAEEQMPGREDWAQMHAQSLAELAVGRPAAATIAADEQVQHQCLEKCCSSHAHGGFAHPAGCILAAASLQPCC